MNRRQFLESVSAASLAALATGLPRRAFAAAAKKIAPTADTVILLWMAGGMAHTETFDPKRFTAFEPGIEAASVLSTFDARPTALDGVFFNQAGRYCGAQSLFSKERDPFASELVYKLDVPWGLLGFHVVQKLSYQFIERDGFDAQVPKKLLFIEILYEITKPLISDRSLGSAQRLMAPSSLFVIEVFDGILLAALNETGFHGFTLFPSIHCRISSSRNNSVCPIL